jgi:rRNA maturation RNase YbeY
LKLIFSGYFYKNEKEKLTFAKNIFLNKFPISKNFIVGFHSVNEEDSKKLNFDSFNKNNPTDVITLPLYDSLQDIQNLNQSNEEVISDIFICRKIIKSNSLSYGKNLIEEMQLILIHGLLHSIGYTHDEEKKLRTLEETIMKKV